MVRAEVIADSVPSFPGRRLTTFVLKFPRFILPEFNTHRMLSKNASSSRAIPVQKMIDAVIDGPAVPMFWGKNQPGMQAQVELGKVEQFYALDHWLYARDAAVKQARELLALGVHKQTANRLLEPWAHATVICSGTDWHNFYHLRTDTAAQPEMCALALAMLAAHNESVPTHRPDGQGVFSWHLPFVSDAERMNLSVESCLKASVARAARVSYLNHDGSSPDIDKDVALHDRLAVSGHVSPFEHQAYPLLGRNANFNDWKQYRSIIPDENHTSFPGLLPK